MSKIEDQNQIDPERDALSGADSGKASAPPQAEIIQFRPSGAKRAHPPQATSSHNVQDDDGDDPGPSAA